MPHKRIAGYRDARGAEHRIRVERSAREFWTVLDIGPDGRGWLKNSPATTTTAPRPRRSPATTPNRPSSSPVAGSKTRTMWCGPPGASAARPAVADRSAAGGSAPAPAAGAAIAGHVRRPVTRTVPHVAEQAHHLVVVHIGVIGKAPAKARGETGIG